jgi:glycosyltransferase involved in cell wall biosynthesis
MDETLRESLQSVLGAVDERFEIIVVDGGSTDDSVEILDEFDKKYHNLRVIRLPPSSERNLGKDRDISVKIASGEYVLTHIDCDDKYDHRIVDLAEAYKQIDEQVDFKFGLTGGHITIARRDYILKIGSYRNLRAAEDLDLWRRMMADGGYINLSCERLYKKIGYYKHRRKKIKRIVDMMTSEFQTGMSYIYYIKYLLLNRSNKQRLVGVSLATIGYLIALSKNTFERPREGLHKYGRYMKYRSTYEMEPGVLEEKYNINVEWGEIKAKY